MREVENPKLYLIAEPVLNPNAMRDYLIEVGGEEWFDRLWDAGEWLNQAQTLVEFMGRLCYRSWAPGLNRNVTKIRGDQDDYLLNVLRSGHGSVLEHAYFNFVIHDASRVLTAELNRHRAGVAISEQSLRYVRLDQDLPFRLPHGVLGSNTIARMRELIEFIETEIGWMYRNEGIDSMESFAEKKAVTSAIRRCAPMGIATEEGWSANVRAIRHVIAMRSDFAAEEEIRVFADQLATIMQQKCPALFGDFHEVPSPTTVLAGTPPAWQTKNRKV